MKHAGSVSAVIYITLGKTLRQIKVENERNLTCKILQCQRVSTVHNKWFLMFCRYLYAQGRNIWKKWKKRYYVLVQVNRVSNYHVV